RRPSRGWGPAGRGEPRARRAVTTRGVIFDMDGVLIDSGAHHRAAWRALLEELGTTPARPDDWRLTIGRPGHEAVSLLLGRDLPSLEAEGIGVPPRACLVFEDSVVGVQAARRAGMQVIGVVTAHTEEELRAAGAARVIDDFEGLAWPL